MPKVTYLDSNEASQAIEVSGGGCIMRGAVMNGTEEIVDGLTVHLPETQM